MNTARKYLVLVCVSAMFIVWAVYNEVLAQEKFPTKPVTLVSGMGPGASIDLTLRLLAKTASAKLKQPVLVVNKEGASGVLAVTEIKNTKPDGYTLGFVSVGPVVAAHLEKVPYHPVKDFDPVIEFGGSNYGILVKSDSPFKKFEDLVAYARENPGKLKYSIYGTFSPQNLVMVQLEEVAKVKWVGVPYDTNALATAALLGGHVHISVTSGAWKQHVTSGRLRLLAVPLNNRLKDFPDVPTLTELGYNVVGLSLWLMVVPKGTPEERIKILHDALYEGMKQPEYKKLLEDCRAEYVYNDPQQCKKRLQEVYEVSGEIIKKMQQKSIDK